MEPEKSGWMDDRRKDEVGGGDGPQAQVQVFSYAVASTPLLIGPTSILAASLCGPLLICLWKQKMLCAQLLSPESQG